MATKRTQVKHPVNKLELPPLVAERISCSLSKWVGEIGKCHWCNEVITGRRRRTWCSDACGRAWQREHIWRFARSAAKRRAKYRCTKPGCTADRRDCEVNHIRALNGLGYGPGCHHHSKPDANGEGGLEVLCRAHHAEITAAQASARAAARREAKEASKETTLWRMAFRDGDGWVMCSCGHRHWGLHGAAGLLLVRRDLDEPRVLLQLRAAWTHGGGTWALPGGALDSHEDSVSAAAREAEEEAGISAADISVCDVFSDDHGPWRYDTVIAHTSTDAGAHAANAESEDLRWVLIDEVADYQLHKGLEAAWPALRLRVLATLTA